MMCWYIIIIVNLLISITVVSTDKSDMVVYTKKESWIPMEILAAVINVSFTTSFCCNAFISGRSAGIENIFNKFVKIYPYEYTLNNRTYECDNYLMIFTAGDGITTTMKNIPTKIATTELLILIDDNIENSMEIFNVSMYENVDVNIIAWNGQWTLSENFLTPRVFRRISSHQEMSYKKGLANLQGRKLEAMAYLKPPFCYLQTTVNLTVGGIKREYFINNNDTELDGVEMKLFMLIAEQLNFTWRVQKAKNDDRYGSPNGTNWEGGMIGHIIKKDVDIAFTSIWLTEEKPLFANMTQPWAMLHIHFMVPRPKPYTSFWALTRPLSPQLWLSIVVMLLIQSVYVHTKAKISSRVPRRFRSFAITWTELMGRLVGMWAPRNIRGFKIQFQIWHMMGLLLVTAYSSSLAARLTNWRYEKRIDNAQAFIKANLTWGDEYLSPTGFNIFDDSDPYAKKYASHFEFETDEEDRHKKMLKGNYAVLGNIIGSSFFPLQSVRNEDLNDFRVMQESIAHYHSSFVVQPWLIESVNQLMFRLQSAGLVPYHIENVLHRRTGSALREVLIEHDGNEGIPRVLKLNPLGAGFAILIMGLSISTVVFYLELRSGSAIRSFREIWHEVKEKRNICSAEALRGTRLSMFDKLKPKKVQFILPPKLREDESL